MMLIDNKYNIKDEVYLKTDSDQRKRIVTSIIIKSDGIMYELVCGENSGWHYDFEITMEKDVIMTSDN